MLPQKAREFFDNFNWERLAIGDENEWVFCFAILLSKIYHVERPPAHAYSNGAGMFEVDEAGGAQLAEVQRAGAIKTEPQDLKKDSIDLVIVRPKIEHNMLGIIMVSVLFLQLSPFVFYVLWLSLA